MRTFLSEPLIWLVMVGTIAYQVSSGFYQNAHSSNMIRSAVQPLQEAGVPGSDMILEPLLNVTQEAFSVWSILPLERTLMASANFTQVFRASDAARCPVDRYRTSELGFLQHMNDAMYAQHHDLPT